MLYVLFYGLTTTFNKHMNTQLTVYWRVEPERPPWRNPSFIQIPKIAIEIQIIRFLITFIVSPLDERQHIQMNWTHVLRDYFRRTTIDDHYYKNSWKHKSNHKFTKQTSIIYMLSQQETHSLCVMLDYKHWVRFRSMVISFTWCVMMVGYCTKINVRTTIIWTYNSRCKKPSNNTNNSRNSIVGHLGLFHYVD